VPKYLIEVSYTAEGVKGLLKDGGSKRKQVAEQALVSAGAKLDAFYFAFGGADAYVIVDAPDHESILAASLTINSSGAVSFRTIVLLSPEELDKAVKKGVTYRAPGS
jgi:uncharacterized protein with GYD domain